MRNRVTLMLDKLFSSRTSDVLLDVAIIAWLTYRIVMTSFFATYLVEPGIVTEAFVFHRILLIIAVCELARIWRGEYGRKDVAALVILVIMACGPWMFDRNALLCDIALVFAARGHDLDRLLRLCVCTVSVCVIVIVLSSIIGIVPDAVIEQGGRSRLRHCLGFTYCLFPAQYLFTTTATLCYLCGRSMRWKEAALLATLNIVCYLLTDSRLSCWLSLALLVVAMLHKAVFENRYWYPVVRGARWAFVGAAVLSAVVVGVYAIQVSLGASWLDELNHILGGRIRLAYDGIKTLGAQPFGQQVTWVGSGLDIYGQRSSATYNYVDNLFLHALIQQGMVYTAGLILLYTHSAFVAQRNDQQMLVLVLAFVALHGLLDDLALQMHYNTLMFVVAAAIPHERQADRPQRSHERAAQRPAAPIPQ